jgi:hypothetical protein
MNLREAGMSNRAVLATLVAAAIGVSPVHVAAQPLPSDHLIVPGIRIGAAELERADQGALFRALGEPNQTEQRGDRAYYMYGADQPDGASPDELVVNFDLANDAPFEISTASPAYHTRDGLGVGSSAIAVRAKLGPPLCEGSNARDDGLIVYRSIWFLTSHGNVTRVSIRNSMNSDDFHTGPVHC